MTTEFARILSELSDSTLIVHGADNDHSPFFLASLADCASPDSIESPGAVFLARVAQEVADYCTPDEGSDARTRLSDLIGDAAHEIADGEVPVYTHERWQVFVDLAAYNEDLVDLVGDKPRDMTDMAGVALYLIAERLVRALAEELSEALDNDEAAQAEAAQAEADEAYADAENYMREVHGI